MSTILATALLAETNAMGASLSKANASGAITMATTNCQMETVLSVLRGASSVAAKECASNAMTDWELLMGSARSAERIATLVIYLNLLSVISAKMITSEGVENLACEHLSSAAW